MKDIILDKVLPIILKVLQVGLIVGKLFGFLNVSWLVVFSPMLIVLGIGIVMIILSAIFVAYNNIKDKMSDK